MKKPFFAFKLLIVTILLSACSFPGPSVEKASLTPPEAASLPSATQISISTAEPSSTATQTSTTTFTSTVTPAPSITPSPEPSSTPTITLTLTQSPTLTPSLTPTFKFPDVVVLEQANCRYGPGTAYLYRWGLYQGDTGIVGGRNYNGAWLWIKPHNLDDYCWVSAAVVEIHGDVFTVREFHSRLPKSTLYGPPTGIKAERNGKKVSVTWNRVNMTEDDDRGYLLEVNVCQKGVLIWMAVHTDTPGYTFTDEPGCKGKSNGILYTVEKHGYTDPVKIPWP